MFDLFHLTHKHSGGDGAFIDHASLLGLNENDHGSIYREKLSANRIYYVLINGNDGNSGLVNSASGAFLTIQHAVDVVAALDINAYTVIIQVGDGTYTGLTTLKNVVGFAALGNLIIQGNSITPSNVVISTTSANCFSSNGLSSVWDIKDMKLQTTTSGRCLSAGNGSMLRFGNIVFGACAHFHIVADGFAKIDAISNYSISGNAIYHLWCIYAGSITLGGATITITNNLAFSTFCVVEAGVLIGVYSGGFSLGAYTVTGKRYDVSKNGVCYVGGSATFFPGNSAGSTATGGQYV